MTAVRPWAEVAADLRSQAVGCDEDIRHVLMREAADCGNALATERDKWEGYFNSCDAARVAVIAVRDAAQAVLAAVQAALDEYDEALDTWDERLHDEAALLALTAVATAVER